jgi:hypothetical protein
VPLRSRSHMIDIVALRVTMVAAMRCRLSMCSVHKVTLVHIAPSGTKQPGIPPQRSSSRSPTASNGFDQETLRLQQHCSSL